MFGFNVIEFICSYFKVGVIIFIIFLLYDIGLLYLDKKIFCFTYELKRKIIYHPKILIHVCRFEKLIHDVIYLIRVKWITYRYSMEDENEVDLYKTIQGNTLQKLIIAGFRFFILSRFAIVTLIITIGCNLKISLRTLFSYENLLILKGFYTKINASYTKINALIQTLPSLIILFTIVASAYYVSIKYKYYVAVNQVNKDYLMRLAKIHKELNKSVTNLIYKGTKNLSRALKIINKETGKYEVKDMIVEKVILCNNYNLSNIIGDKVIWSEKNNLFKYGNNSKENIANGFDEIEEIDKIVHIFKQSKKEGYYYNLEKFACLDRKILNLKEYRLNDVAYLNKIFLTKEGISNIIKDSKHEFKNNKWEDYMPNDDEIDEYNKMILKERDNLKITIDDNIIEAIELLIDLFKYVDATNKIFDLNSKKLSNRIGQILGFNK